METYHDFFICYLIFSGMVVFTSSRKYLLLTLLSLEFLALSVYLLMFVFLMFYFLSYYFILVYLTFIVCEGVLGLGLLVSLIRVHGNDSISVLAILGW